MINNLINTNDASNYRLLKINMIPKILQITQKQDQLDVSFINRFLTNLH